MANFQSMLQTAIFAVSTQEFSKYDEQTNFVNKIITIAILENTLEKYIDSNKDNIGNIQDIANSYVTIFKTEVEEFKKKYTSYKQLLNKVISYNIQTLLSITEQQVNEICDIYKNRQTKNELSTTSFSQYMYSTSGLGIEDATRLSNAHYNIIVPIIQTLQIRYGIKLSDIDVNLSDGQVGRCFILAVSGISAISLYHDLYTIDLSTMKYKFYTVKILNQNEIEIILK